MAINKNEFYEKYAPIAIEQQIKYGIPASVTLAQMGFESSFGTSRLARESSNFFGVKQGSSWKGPVSYHIDDHNHPEAFRVYQDVRASVEDHSKVLLLPRYQKHCGSKSSQDYQGWADGIMAGGYAAGYYSYKWAEVLDADAFSVFKRHGIFDRETAQRFRDCILSKGSTEHPMTLYKNFRGGEPTIKALLKRNGIGRCGKLKN